VSRPPVPLSQFVLKIHSRCDLARDHCYVYGSADQRWHGRPLTMSDAVISRTTQRIAEHVESHRLDSVQVVSHGGQPLLACRAKLGSDVFDDSPGALRRPPGITARQRGPARLCRTCQECPVITSCGGGLYTHRYRAAIGFGNPSLYCADLLRLITRISSGRAEMTAVRQEDLTDVLSGRNFCTSAAGSADVATVTRLIERRRSLRRVLLGAVCRVGITGPAVSDGVKAAPQSVWAPLTTIHRDQPEALDAFESDSRLATQISIDMFWQYVMASMSEDDCLQNQFDTLSATCLRRGILADYFPFTELLAAISEISRDCP
jgi:hypothetical protein